MLRTSLTNWAPVLAQPLPPTLSVPLQQKHHNEVIVMRGEQPINSTCTIELRLKIGMRMHRDISIAD